MKIMKMTIENLPSLRRFELDLNGRSAKIHGENGTGKSTIYNAFTWLIFGKFATADSNYSPKTIEGNEYAHNLNHSVECVLEINGEIKTFKRVYHEVWKKIRGNAEAEFSEIGRAHV